MVTEICLYVEGGGDSKFTKDPIRRGFSGFLNDLVQCARQKGLRWSIIACGGREQTYDNFLLALRSHPDALNVLLVDAEAPVRSPPWQHLRDHDGWHQPHGTRDEQCHLMVQNMEAWLFADRGALERFYGAGFATAALPANRNVEQIDTTVLANGLMRATQRTKKGVYKKIQHGAALLEQVDPTTVRAAAPLCDRLFVTLASEMGGCP